MDKNTVDHNVSVSETHGSTKSELRRRRVANVGADGARTSGVAAGTDRDRASTQRPGAGYRHVDTPVKHEKQGAGGTAQTVNLVSADALKDQVHKNIGQADYDVANCYWETGWAQAIARNQFFGNLTLVVITLNALWIGIDTEFNNADNLNDAELHFQFMEYFFFGFFFLEWLIRFMAFKQKVNGFKDFWFSFDTFLVALMVLETLITPYALAAPAAEESIVPRVTGNASHLTNVTRSSNSTPCGGTEVRTAPGSSANLSQLSMLRMLRLLRLTRMVRLMRSVPELVALLSSMKIALRSVLSCCALLVIFMYVFAIIFKSQMKPQGTYMVRKFSRVPDCMWTLLLSGTLLDSVTICANNIRKESLPMAVLFIIYVMLSAFTVLNMLVGLLCEVVNAVSEAEKEKALVSYVKGRLMGVLERLDEDGNGTISREEFDQLVMIPEAVETLETMGVDVPNLVSLADHLFQADEYEIRPAAEPEPVLKGQGTFEAITLESQDSLQPTDALCTASALDIESEEIAEKISDEGVTLSFADFLEMVLRLRATQQPSVLDIVDLRKLIMKHQKITSRRLDELEEKNNRLHMELQWIHRLIERLSAPGVMAALIEWCVPGGQGIAEEAEKSTVLRLPDDEDEHDHALEEYQRMSPRQKTPVESGCEDPNVNEDLSRNLYVRAQSSKTSDESWSSTDDEAAQEGGDRLRAGARVLEHWPATTK